MTTPIRSDPLPWVLVVLTVTTGLVDAVSVLGLGRVFTANMTGNIVFLGFAAVGVPGFSVARAVMALAGFVVGAMLGGRLGVAMAGMARRRWLLTVALVEAGCFFVAAWVASGYDLVTFTPMPTLYALILLTAVAMGLRNATVRRLVVPDLTTTVLTLTLTGIAADSTLAGVAATHGSGGVSARCWRSSPGPPSGRCSCLWADSPRRSWSPARVSCSSLSPTSHIQPQRW